MAARLLANQPGNEGPRRIGSAWTTSDGTRVALAAVLGEPLPQAERHEWLDMARGLIDTWLVAEHALVRVHSLQKSERLQQALYEIADLSGSDMDVSEMLERIHHVVGGLMYAENLYIVLYDEVRATIRFLYFADSRDPYVADPGREIHERELPNSMTFALLKKGEAQFGPSAEIRHRLGVSRDIAHGPDSEDWLGVPIRRDDHVCGALVVQSYERANVYGEEERALLSYVAQHILTALDRRRARDELERRVEERTYALQLTNRDLQAEIVERQRAERLQRALFRIAELSITSGSLERFYAQIHDVVGELLYARNFYIAILRDDDNTLGFPYSVDEREPVRPTRKLGSGLTEWVIRAGKALLADSQRLLQLENSGEVSPRGAMPHCWLGVPLFHEGAVVGVIAVQSYSVAISFTRRDQELLTFVAHHISNGLARKRAQDRLVAAHADLEQRVQARTQELAQANAELLEQIGERLRAEQRLTYQARHDALTGLPNRSQLLERLGLAISRARQQPAATPSFAVLFLDLDRFKLVNDSAGHSAGDHLLVEAGRRIVAAVREDDTVARLGGDEFAILVENLDEKHDSQIVVETLAQRILSLLSQPCWVAGREVFPSASIGIAFWNPRYRNGADLLRDADAAMYRAKAAGRDRWAIFDQAMRDQAVRILDLEADLRRAINNDDFVAFYQPIICLESNAVVGHEALLRWKHERRGLLLPGEFIGMGEDCGLIEQVDWLMYRRVLRHLAAEPGDSYVSINVSPRHFRATDFGDRLLRLADEAGADPSRLRIEITEVALLDDIARAIRMLHNLREHGVLAQIDDFGTGYSALSYLHRFPIECLKIDRSFVAGLDAGGGQESVAVIRAIQALAGTLGIYTIGEGIETGEQSRILAELGCTRGQGYLYGRPVETPMYEVAAA
ncbi:EAL domain-containing protein [Lysobacter alkalisoli]|uniref:EAL domain-containing protein n=2 Tax=Marilutibacter alkalisoli TaxID=2591633 RepID=A0A514BWR9_9GAMM|nr:EAL domain-containing protein [Lysobacter alkalisoli]